MQCQRTLAIILMDFLAGNIRFNALESLSKALKPSFNVLNGRFNALKMAKATPFDRENRRKDAMGG